jgi:hypothetical protein
MEWLEDKVIEILKSIGYEYSENDYVLLTFCMDKVVSELNSRCHTKELPKGLEESAIDRVCGEFLYTLKSAGKLEEFDLEQGVSSVKVGDTSVNFSGTSPDSAFNNLIGTLRNSGEELIKCFRKIQF